MGFSSSEPIAYGRGRVVPCQIPQCYLGHGGRTSTMQGRGRGSRACV
jgi:hypothetical protein